MRMICVVDRNWGVGREEALLFYIPQDMRFFKQTTTGNVVVMGKNTLLSFPGQKPLKERINIVLSKDPIEEEGVVQCATMDELMEEVSHFDPDSVFLIGGASMYDQLMDCCTEALITRVNAVGDADRSICSLDDREGWELVDVSEPQEDNGFTFVFTKYVNHNVRSTPTPIGGRSAAAPEEKHDEETETEALESEPAEETVEETVQVTEEPVPEEHPEAEREEPAEAAAPEQLQEETPDTSEAPAKEEE